MTTAPSRVSAMALYRIKMALVPRFARPGTWYRSGGEVTVICPKCETRATLNHQIADDGKVKPSLDCPTEDCDFHQYVILVDWVPYETPMKPLEGSA